MPRISPKARIGSGVDIAETAVVHDNVEIGDGSVIGDFCIIGHPARGEFAGRPLRLGPGALVRSHSVLYEGSVFGPGLMVGHSTMIREGVAAGVNLQIGSFNDIEGDCTIGDWVRFHSNVHVSRGTSIGDLVWIFPYTVTTNDPIPPSGLKVGVRIDSGAALCTGSIVLPGARVGEGALIGAMTRAQGEIPAGALVVGNPGKTVGSVRRLRHPETGKQHPWMRHFSPYYPEEAQPRIRELAARVEAACDVLDAAAR